MLLNGLKLTTDWILEFGFWILDSVAGDLWIEWGVGCRISADGQLARYDGILAQLLTGLQVPKYKGGAFPFGKIYVQPRRELWGWEWGNVEDCEQEQTQKRPHSQG